MFISPGLIFRILRYFQLFVMLLISPFKYVFLFLQVRLVTIRIYPAFIRGFLTREHFYVLHFMLTGMNVSTKILRQDQTQNVEDEFCLRSSRFVNWRTDSAINGTYLRSRGNIWRCKSISLQTR